MFLFTQLDNINIYVNIYMNFINKNNFYDNLFSHVLKKLYL